MPRRRMPWPPKPKSCITCKRRFKACDRTIPCCMECTNEGLICSGYEDPDQGIAWALATQKSMGRSFGHSRPQPTATPSSSVSKRATISGHVHIIGTTIWPTSLPQACELSTNGWMAAIHELYDTEPSIRYAALAMSTGIISAMGSNTQLWTQSMQAYNRSVQELVQALNDPRRSQSEGIMVTTRIIQCYELLFGQANKWRTHLEGQLAMFLARGPQSFTLGHAHQLYVDGRILMITLALGKRVKSPLRTREWRTIPYTYESRSTKDKLLDVLEDILEILVQYDHLCACQCPGDVDRFRNIILANCQRVERSLYIWEKESGLHIDMFDYLASGFPLPTPQNDLEFGVLHISSLYWTVGLVLYTTIEQVSSFTFQMKGYPSRAQEPTDPPIPPTTRPAEANWTMSNPRFYANKIAHSMHLFFEPKAGVVQGASSLFPMAMALQFFTRTESEGQRSREWQMLMDLFERPFMGSYVGRLMSELQVGATGSMKPASQAQRNIWWYQVMGQSNASGPFETPSLANYAQQASAPQGR
ncbi:hypothetical protein PT974_04593 [Cladobotryum mycophilum]|uniref:Zn(2)-C6 fungal-type domain-containing protein n=1 Tax=Cladobotryum mycophilum TaxID=491253 RepID=A0ABR0SWL9_9HYPO